MTVASGANILFGLRRETSYQVPDDSESYVWSKPLLPLNAALVRRENPSGEVNPSGWVEVGVPGAVEGPIELSLPFTAGHVLEFYEHFFRSVDKDTADDVFTFIFTPDPDGTDSSFQALYSKPPVERELFYGVKFSSVSHDIGDNTPIATKLKGVISQGTRLSGPVPAEANTGSYDKGPFLRGPLADRTAGDVYVKVTSLGPPVQFKVEVCDGDPAPTYPGSAHSILYDADDNGIWQNLQGGDDLDLGIWGENYDPLEILWPGTDTEHADLDVGDVFVFQVSWADPARTYLTGQRFTSAHLRVYYREVGGPTWIELPSQLAVSIGFELPLTVSRGTTSRYVTGLDRGTILKPTVTLNRKLANTLFRDFAELHTRLELKLEFTGQQIGTTYSTRERITYEYCSMSIAELARPVSKQEPIEETITLIGETNSDGDPPVVVTVESARDWDPVADVESE
jgi:hypothetical protein